MKNFLYLIGLLLILTAAGCTQVTMYSVKGEWQSPYYAYPAYAPDADFYYDGYAYSGPYPFTSRTAYRLHDYTEL